jgi:FKBP-type peptidyl-prolyl cis-trans isomerase FklB
MQLKKIAFAVMGLTATTVFAATDVTSSLKTELEKLSYSIGVDLGQNMKKQGIEISPAAMVKGMEDGIADGKLLLTEQQMKDVLLNFQKELMAKRTAQFDKAASDNKAKGEEFLAANKNKPGVVTLPSGLQYKIVTAGTGKKPGKDDNVTVEYKGTLINGTVFDSSEKAGKPATFKLSQVIPGWTEALQLMPVGSTWELYVPAALAYGTRNVGGLIGPNETLIFNVHLLDAKP